MPDIGPNRAKPKRRNRTDWEMVMSVSRLPVRGDEKRLQDEGYLRVADSQAELRLNAKARQMLAVMRTRDELDRAMSLIVLDPAWLDRKGWHVVLRIRDNSLRWDEPLCAALQRRRQEMLFGVAVDTRWPEPSAVWQVRADPENIEGFRVNTSSIATILFPKELSCAVLNHVDDPVVVAGPADFVAEALSGEVSEARSQLEAQIGDGDHPPQWYIDLVTHYRPFLRREHR